MNNRFFYVSYVYSTGDGASGFGSITFVTKNGKYFNYEELVDRIRVSNNDADRIILLNIIEFDEKDYNNFIGKGGRDDN